MANNFDLMENSNRSANPSIHEVSDPARWVFLLGGIDALTVGALAPWLVGRVVVVVGREPLIGFKSVPVSEQDMVLVPEGYEAVAFVAWGEPVGVADKMPSFRWDASNSAAEQAVQMGRHHDDTGTLGCRALRAHQVGDVTRIQGGTAVRFAEVIGSILLAAIGLAGCASTNTAIEPRSLDGSAWVLASLPGRSLVADATPTARFADGRVAGTDGCNRYSMPFTAEGSALRIGPIGPSTRMACPERTMAQAEAFTSALVSARSFRRGDGTLELLDAGGTLAATLVTQAQSLAGTSWNVVNINNGRQAVVGIIADATLTMAFDTDGTVSGTTGCNRYTAAYQAEGETLRFSSVAATRMACPDQPLAEQEQAFLRALESVATLSFEGDRLDLRTADGALAIILVREQ